jgi:hypothetical protein
MKVILTHDQSFVEAVKHTQITLAPVAFTMSGLSYTPTIQTVAPAK